MPDGWPFVIPRISLVVEGAVGQDGLVYDDAAVVGGIEAGDALEIGFGQVGVGELGLVQFYVSQIATGEVAAGQVSAL